MNPKPIATGVLRAFVAVELPAELLKSLAAVQTEMRRGGVRARWTRPENLHLTLKFIGDLPADRVADVANALRSAAAGHPPFRLTAAGLGVFPGGRRPRVLWAGLSGALAALEGLQRELDDRLAACGLEREARGFHGHLTLGRFGPGAPGGADAEVMSAHAAQRFGSFDVRELVLFQSDLMPGGPVYTALARARLSEAA